MLIRIFMTEKLNFEERAYYAPAFDSTFGSLRCFELRPAGFSENDPPHMCENLTCKGIEFSYQYILKITKK